MVFDGPDAAPAGAAELAVSAASGGLEALRELFVECLDDRRLETTTPPEALAFLELLPSLQALRTGHKLRALPAALTALTRLDVASATLDAAGWAALAALPALTDLCVRWTPPEDGGGPGAAVLPGVTSLRLSPFGEDGGRYALRHVAAAFPNAVKVEMLSNAFSDLAPGAGRWRGVRSLRLVNMLEEEADAGWPGLLTLLREVGGGLRQLVAYWLKGEGRQVVDAGSLAEALRLCPALEELTLSCGAPPLADGFAAAPRGHPLKALRLYCRSAHRRIGEEAVAAARAALPGLRDVQLKVRS